MSTRRKHLIGSSMLFFTVLFCYTLSFAAGPDQLVLNLPSFAITVDKDASGQAVFQNTALDGEPGSPELPCQTVHVLLPPNAVLTSVKVSLTGVTYKNLEGLWDVKPAPPRRTLSDNTGEWPEGIVILDGRDQKVYRNNTFFPENNLGPVTVGQQRKWKLASIQIAPFQFNPAIRSLRQLTGGKIVVSYQQDDSGLSRDPISQGMKQSISDKVINFNAMAPLYEAKVQNMFFRSAAVTNPGYAIITTDSIRSQSKVLDKFVATKKARGFEVSVVTESTWGGGAGVTGDTAAEKLRSWLQANYQNLNLQYVLLIGNPDPQKGDVPMKMCWPRYNASNNRECPTDAYYADLTGNWDINGNKIFGEVIDFMNAGGADFNYEVLVGRIPYYGDIKDVDGILAKTVNYGNIAAVDAAWRQRVLLAMKPFASDDSYPYKVEENFRLGEKIVDDVLKVKEGMKWFRIYEKDFNLNPAPERTPCNAQIVKEVWSNTGFGAVVWATHGLNETLASGIMNLDSVASLNNNYPAYTFQLSCWNAAPEDKNNLSYALLKQGAIGTVGATRVGWGYYPGSISGTGYNAFELGYRYIKNMIGNTLAVGDALEEAKAAAAPRDDCEIMNYLDYNLYGDPSLGLFSYQQQPSLYLTLPTVVDEMGIYQGQVSIGEALSYDLAVGLTSSDPQVRVPTQVNIPAGQRSAEFGVIVRPDPTINEYKMTVISATANGYQEGVNALRVNGK